MIPNLAVDLKHSDYEWSPAETVQPEVVQPATQPATISADELARRMALHCDELMRDPDWQAKLLRKNAELKAARLAARRQRKATK